MIAPAAAGYKPMLARPFVMAIGRDENQWSVVTQRPDDLVIYDGTLTDADCRRLICENVIALVRLASLAAPKALNFSPVSRPVAVNELPPRHVVEEASKPLASVRVIDSS